MTSVRTRSRGLVKATGLLLASLIALPSAADDHDQAQAAMDGVAYQLIQLLNQNEELTNEIAGLRGQVEELLDDAQRSRESQLKIAADFDNRIGTIESKPDVDNSEEKARIAELESRLQQLEEALTAMHEVVTTIAAAPAAKSAPETIYESALEKYQAGDYAAAIEELEAFITLYGKDPAWASAHYWLAEALLRQGEHDRAIETAETLLHDSPDSDKAPDTMFLLGKTHLELGDAGGARSAWENLVLVHPDSDQATKARHLLEQLP